MSNVIYMLDACSIINLIHIDVDGKLFRRLSKINITLCETVFAEVCKNVYLKIDKSKLGAKDSREIRKEIDQNLGVIRGWQFINGRIIQDLGSDYFQRIAGMTGYDKKNGEFFSAAVAMALTRMDDVKLFFHTDDFPAKTEFEAFFREQQIGYIEDTTDLLILLYRLDENFSALELDKALSRLASEYNREVADLEKKLGQIQITAKQIKGCRRLVENRQLLLHKLNQHDFDGLSSLFAFFELQKTQCPLISDLLDNHKEILDLESSNQKNLVAKISALRTRLKERPVYRLDYLLSA